MRLNRVKKKINQKLEMLKKYLKIVMTVKLIVVSKKMLERRIKSN